MNLYGFVFDNYLPGFVSFGFCLDFAKKTIWFCGQIKTIIKLWVCIYVFQIQNNKNNNLFFFFKNVNFMMIAQLLLFFDGKIKRWKFWLCVIPFCTNFKTYCTIIPVICRSCGRRKTGGGTGAGAKEVEKKKKKSQKKKPLMLCKRLRKEGGCSWGHRVVG